MLVCKIILCEYSLMHKKRHKTILKKIFVKRSEDMYSFNYSWYQQVQIWKRMEKYKNWFPFLNQSLDLTPMYRKIFRRKICRLNIDKIFNSPRQQLLLRTLTRWAKVFLLLFFAIFKKEFLKMRHTKCRLLKCNPLINP